MEFRGIKKQYEVLKLQIDNAIANVLAEGCFISGPRIQELERRLADYVGVKNCITCANGTDALTLALMTWQVGPGDVVFVPDFTFFASGETIAYAGATPIFVDVDASTYNMDPDKLERVICQTEQEGKYCPKVVITVDLFGLPANYLRIREICERHHLLLLEDGAQGFGGSIQGKRACSFGDISTTSFFPAKPLGCYGDGGAVFTDNDEWAALIRSYAVHGKGDMKYDNVRVGMNSRLDTLQAAILDVKLKAFREYEFEAADQVSRWYDRLLVNSDLILPARPNGFVSSWAQYTLQLPETIDRDALQAKLKEQGIPTIVYYPKPMHAQLAFAGTGSAKADCPVTERLCRTVLSLPIHPYLENEECSQIAESMVKILQVLSHN